MSKWLATITAPASLPEIVKELVEDARDQAIHLGVDCLGVVEIVDNGESFYVIRKGDFNEWFGD